MHSKLNPAGWTRLIIYIISGLIGLTAVVVNALGMGDLSLLLGTVAGAGAAITGGTAAANLPKAPDQSRTGGLELEKLVPAILEIAAAASAYRSAVEYQPKHEAPAPQASTLPVYTGPTTNEG
ncbi:hypothetical protein ACL1NM_11950 [Corynebacterium striatum]